MSLAVKMADQACVLEDVTGCDCLGNLLKTHKIIFIKQKLHQLGCLGGWLKALQKAFLEIRKKGLVECHSPVGVSCDLIAHHHTVHQPFSQEASVIMTQLHRGQLPQVLTLNTDTQPRENLVHI